MDQNEVNVLENMLQRFAVSALSKERKDEALNEEILVGKYTGEFFIKTKDGVVISTDVLNRLKASMELAIKAAESNGIAGNVYHVDFDNLNLPNHMDYGVNILIDEPIELPENTKEFLLNIDFDEYDIINDSIKPIVSSGNVIIDYELTTNNTPMNQQVSFPLDIINQSIVKMEVEEGTIINGVRILGITIERDVNVFNADATDRAFILHNVFVTVNNN